jgi:hypothetical protein
MIDDRGIRRGMAGETAAFRSVVMVDLVIGLWAVV